ncbi:hypothetical protein DICVIV_07886 [Dictyocaulus viviparus]|uniref:Uncharacterized protein n=1 Tax=Dictyocaulus viviparus TaxID=29172 RepID=A0A0D8XUH7_DICVI|nr:hypothetical protein DICVIV_07886 [Dictyocaulus viviparus]
MEYEDLENHFIVRKLKVVCNRLISFSFLNFGGATGQQLLRTMLRKTALLLLVMFFVSVVLKEECVDKMDKCRAFCKQKGSEEASCHKRFGCGCKLNTSWWDIVRNS